MLSSLWKPSPSTSSSRILLLSARCKTTRPQEWKDRSKFAVKIHPDQAPVEETPTSKHKWMDVRWKNKNSAETLIHSLAIDETRRTSPQEARQISDHKMDMLRNSLTAKGERKAYEPPENVQQEIQIAFEDVFSSKFSADLWHDHPLSDHKLKYKFLLLCASRLNHEVPNSDLYLMKTARDVVNFYKTPVRGAMTYDHLIRIQNKDELPANLYLIKDAIRYDPNSEFMGGIDAFPGNPDTVFGIREKMKYPSVKETFKWPDI